MKLNNTQIFNFKPANTPKNMATHFQGVGIKTQSKFKTPTNFIKSNKRHPLSFSNELMTSVKSNNENDRAREEQGSYLTTKEDSSRPETIQYATPPDNENDNKALINIDCGRIHFDHQFDTIMKKKNNMLKNQRDNVFRR